MITKHKSFRINRRKKYLKVLKYKDLNGYIYPSDYQKIKRYELRKKRISKGRKHYYDTHKNGKFNIELPSNIDFEDNIYETYSIQKQVDDFLKNRIHQNFVINHQKVKNASIAGLLYLVSQISKIGQSKYKKSKVEYNYNKAYGLASADEKLKYLFKKIGYWDYFGIQHPYEISDETINNYFLSIESSTTSEFHLLNKIKQFVKVNVDFLDDYHIEYKFDDILKEAMGNSLEHAYPEEFNSFGKEKNRWWVCGHYNKINKSLELVFYDYGVGIRESMRRNLGSEAKRAMFDKIQDKILRSDADLIQMAIHSDLSKYKNYKEQDRGKGLKRFKDFAESTGCSTEFTLISNKGKYKFCYDSINGTSEEIKDNLNEAIDGTLIKWKIRLEEKTYDR